MLFMLMYLYSMMMITFMLIIINMIIMKKKFLNYEKSSPYECGFDPISNNRLPFSLQFYLVSLIFLIFDIEISLLLPLMKCFKSMYFMNMTNILMLMTVILLLGLMIELKEGALKWFY
uniref:NADH-ubiquinone oxidoreductase chain 3 n=1 Tax=Belyta sp. ZJUH_2016005 TaxID=2491151 RepID=A0A3S8V0F2_9HYME|nr:NADH dehydrogenase subunit 3 [Belyta sp. ZJUH_2016005]